jgi:hypothetical protein
MHLSFVFQSGGTAGASLPLNPFLFPSIREYRRAIFKLHAIRFTTHKKAHYLAIDYANVFQI